MTMRTDAMANRHPRATRVAAEIDDPRLAQIVDRLVKLYRPERVYLFGSRARGATTADSDYDLMVIVPDETPPERRASAPAYEALWDLHTAVDVLVWPRAAFEARLHLQASLPSAIEREGTLVYSR